MPASTIQPTSPLGYSVQWSPDDDEFVATFTHFPSLSWLAPTQDETLRGLEALVVEVCEEMSLDVAARSDAFRNNSGAAI